MIRVEVLPLFSLRPQFRWGVALRKTGTEGMRDFRFTKTAQTFFGYKSSTCKLGESTLIQKLTVGAILELALIPHVCLAGPS